MATGWVQDEFNYVFGATTVTKAFGSNVVAGNFVVGGVRWESGTVTLSSVDKSAGTATIGTAVLLNNPTTYSTTNRAALFYVEITGSGSLTMRATWSGSVNGGFTFHEVSGVSTSSPLIASAMQPQTDPGTGTNALDSGALSSSAASGDYLFGFFVDVNIDPVTFTAGTSPVVYTIRQIDANDMFTESATTGGSKATGTWTSATADAISGCVALLQSGGAASPKLLASLGVG